DEGLVEITGTQAAGPSLKTRMHYGITHEGLLRLKTELKRFEYVAAIGKTIPLPGDELSVELQRVLHNLKIGANRP
ncbi:MAG TPA: hypothetical protein VLF67_04890, partial [Candidatus Saccharimonas sp.]|nr:hypothetical protein [Candidatus Saccharimonas sp.]